MWPAISFILQEPLIHCSLQAVSRKSHPNENRANLVIPYGFYTYINYTFECSTIIKQKNIIKRNIPYNYILQYAQR